MQFCSKEELFLHLLEAYRLNRKAREQEKRNNLQSMMNKMDLENALYEQHIILQRNEELLRSNKLDPFTEVLNKTAFRNHVLEAIRGKRADEKGTFFILDIDNFKIINDTCGHLVGDQVIMKVAANLQNNLREEDLVGRIGGDEFCMYLNHISCIEDIEKNALRIIDNIRNLNISKLQKQLTVSMEICIVDIEKDFEDIFMKADHALYEAKANGRDQFVVYKNDYFSQIMQKKEKRKDRHEVTVNDILPKVFEMLNVFDKRDELNFQPTSKMGHSIFGRLRCFATSVVHSSGVTRGLRFLESYEYTILWQILAALASGKKGPYRHAARGAGDPGARSGHEFAGQRGLP